MEHRKQLLQKLKEESFKEDVEEIAHDISSGACMSHASKVLNLLSNYFSKHKDSNADEVINCLPIINACYHVIINSHIQPIQCSNLQKAFYFSIHHLLKLQHLPMVFTIIPVMSEISAMNHDESMSMLHHNIYLLLWNSAIKFCTDQSSFDPADILMLRLSALQFLTGSEHGSLKKLCEQGDKALNYYLCSKKNGDMTHAFNFVRHFFVLFRSSVNDTFDDYLRVTSQLFRWIDYFGQSSFDQSTLAQFINLFIQEEENWCFFLDRFSSTWWTGFVGIANNFALFIQYSHEFYMESFIKELLILCGTVKESYMNTYFHPTWLCLQVAMIIVKNLPDSTYKKTSFSLVRVLLHSTRQVLNVYNDFFPCVTANCHEWALHVVYAQIHVFQVYTTLMTVYIGIEIGHTIHLLSDYNDQMVLCNKHVYEVLVLCPGSVHVVENYWLTDLQNVWMLSKCLNVDSVYSIELLAILQQSILLRIKHKDVTKPLTELWPEMHNMSKKLSELGKLHDALLWLTLAAISLPKSHLPAVFNRWSSVKRAAREQGMTSIQKLTILEIYHDKKIFDITIPFKNEHLIDCLEEERKKEKDNTAALSCLVGLQELVIDPLHYGWNLVQQAICHWKLGDYRQKEPMEKCQLAVKMVTSNIMGNSTTEKCASQILLSAIHFWWFLCEQQYYQQIMDVEINAGTVSTLESPEVMKGDEVNPNDICDVTPVFRSLVVEREANLLFNLDKALEILEDSLQKSSAKEALALLDNDLIIQCVRDMHCVYYLHHNVPKRIRSLAGLYHVGKILANTDIIVEAVSEMLKITPHIPKEYVEESETYYHLLKNNQKMSCSFVNLMIGRAWHCLHIGKFDAGWKLLREIGDLERHEDSHAMTALLCQACYLASRYSHLGQWKPELPALCPAELGQLCFRYLASLTDEPKLKWAYPGEPQYMIALLLDVCLWMGQIFCEMAIPRHARCYLKTQLLTAQKMALSVRSAEYISILAHIDLLCDNVNDCMMKVHGLRTILYGQDVATLCSASDTPLPWQIRYRPNTRDRFKTNPKKDSLYLSIPKPISIATHPAPPIPLEKPDISLHRCNPVRRSKYDRNGGHSPTSESLPIVQLPVPTYVSHEKGCVCQRCTNPPLLRLQVVLGRLDLQCRLRLGKVPEALYEYHRALEYLDGIQSWEEYSMITSPLITKPIAQALPTLPLADVEVDKLLMAFEFAEALINHAYIKKALEVNSSLREKLCSLGGVFIFQGSCLPVKFVEQRVACEKVLAEALTREYIDYSSVDITVEDLSLRTPSPTNMNQAFISLDNQSDSAPNWSDDEEELPSTTKQLKPKQLVYSDSDDESEKGQKTTSVTQPQTVTRLSHSARSTRSRLVVHSDSNSESAKEDVKKKSKSASAKKRTRPVVKKPTLR